MHKIINEKRTLNELKLYNAVMKASVLNIKCKLIENDMKNERLQRGGQRYTVDVNRNVICGKSYLHYKMF